MFAVRQAKAAKEWAEEQELSRRLASEYNGVLVKAKLGLMQKLAKWVPVYRSERGKKPYGIILRTRDFVLVVGQKLAEGQGQLNRG